MYNKIIRINSELVLKQTTTVGIDSKSVRTNQSSINRTGFDLVPTEKYHGIPEIVRQFKGFSARRINAIRNTQGQTIWQRSYYDHIIRNEK